MGVDMQERLWEQNKKVAMKILSKALNVETGKQVIDEKALEKKTHAYYLAELNTFIESGWGGVIFL